MPGTVLLENFEQMRMLEGGEERDKRMWKKGAKRCIQNSYYKRGVVLIASGVAWVHIVHLLDCRF